MYISDIRRTIIGYIVATIFAFITNKVYALFGHGVLSDAMTWMFLYPLLGGIVVYLLIMIMLPKLQTNKNFRVFKNLYNSGIATLTIGSFLKGVMEIAGTYSKYIMAYFYVGSVFIVLGLIVLCVKNEKIARS